MALEDENVDLQVVTDEPEPDFAELAAAALDNAGINADERIQAAHRKANERMQAAAQHETWILARHLSRGTTTKSCTKSPLTCPMMAFYF